MVRKYFNETYEEFVKECTLNEWCSISYSVYQRISSRTPEQRYQDEKNPTCGWNHKSDVHSIE
ncbi:MAG: hypothetical protein ACRD5J_19905, partial [Nitrososphaeraceae archaeon]